MANITGTEGADTLQGTGQSDNIQALSGDDRVIGSTGTDTIDGGVGKDLLDYSASIGEVYLQLGTTQSTILKTFGDYGTDTVTNVEKIVGNLQNKLSLDGSLYQANNTIQGLFLPNGTTLNVDLAKNQLTYTAGASGTKTLTVENFNSVFGVNGNNQLTGNDFDNFIYTGIDYEISSGANLNYSNVIIGSKGKDLLNGISQKNSTIDYSNLGTAETVKISADGSRFSFQMGIDKGDFGKDTIIGLFQKIIGSTNQQNTIDASGDRNTLGSLDVNLASNSLKFNTPTANNLGVKNPQFEVINFVNVVGGKSNDKIAGSNADSKLTGGGGSDTISGGTGNDLLTGTASTAKGVGEVDTLTGGGGKNKFILGDSQGAYYLGNGSNDYTTITDFNLFQDSIDLGSLKDYSFALEGTNTIDLFSGKDVNTRDLIAKINIADLGITSASTGTSSNNRSISNSSIVDSVSTTSVDAISSKINILSDPAI